MAPTNFAGQPISLVKELRRRGVDARLVEYRGAAKAGKFKYDIDRVVEYTVATRAAVQYQTLEELLADGTTVFHFWYRSLIYHGVYEKFSGIDIPVIRQHGRNVVYRFTGEDLRIKSIHMERNPFNAHKYGYETKIDEKRQRAYLDFLREHVDRFVVQDPEMHEFCPDASIVPRSIDVEAFPFVGVAHTACPLVVHAPSIPEIKGTRFVRQAVEALQGEGLKFEYREISNLSNQEAIELYRRADIVIDQLHIGWHGVLALEAMALGKPVITYIRDDLHASALPRVPILNANPSNVTEVLRTAIKDYDLRSELARQGRAHVEAVHDVRKVAESLLRVYEGLPEKAPVVPPTYPTVTYLRSQQELADAELLALKRKINDYEKQRGRAAGAGTPVGAADARKGLVSTIRSGLRKLLD